MNRVRPGRVLVLLVVVVMINLPLTHSWWTDQRLDRSGIEVDAQVVEVDELPPADDPRYWVSYRLPAEIDPDARTWASEVDAKAYAEASRLELLPVEVVVGSPAVNRAVDRVERGFGLWMTLFADGALLIVGTLYLVSRRRGRLLDVRMVAVCDLERAKPGYSLEEGENGLWIARGEVIDLGEDRVVLDVGGGQKVTVDLDGNANPASYQQPVRAFGRLLS